MLRFRDQASYFSVNRIGSECSQLRSALAQHPGRQRRTARDGSRTAADLVARYCDASLVELRGKPQNIAAYRIFDLYRRRGWFELAHVSWIFEMIEKGVSVHGCLFHYESLSKRRREVTTVVAAVIERQGRILIAQRKDTGPHALKWEFPGGKVEQGETPEQAAVRELREELGIEATIASEIARYEYQYPGRSPILLVFLRVTDFAGEPQNLDFNRIRWEEPAKLADYDFLEGDRDFLRRFR